MSIIRCRECQKEVSSQAETCPHCGAAAPEKSLAISKLKDPRIAFWLGLFLGPIGMLYSTVVGAVVMFFLIGVLGFLGGFLGFAIWRTLGAGPMDSGLMCIIMIWLSAALPCALWAQRAAITSNRRFGSGKDEPWAGPGGDETLPSLHGRHMALGAKILVVVNVVVFLVNSITGHSSNNLFLFGLVPQGVLQEGWVWQLVTYMFVHTGILHLFFDMFMLWMFGRAVELKLGTRTFLKCYFICGLSVALVKVALWPNSTIPLIGASGAIFGLLVAFAMCCPKEVILSYSFIEIKVAHIAIFCGVMEFLILLGGVNDLAHMDNFTHLAGLVGGYSYIRYYQFRRRNEVPGAKI